MVKLNLGSGDLKLDGYDNIDIKDGKNVYPLDYKSRTVDEIRASHILEHFGIREIMPVLKDWVNKLREGGVLKIAVPDYRIIAKKYLDGEKLNFPGYIMGGQIDENDFHKSIFDRAILTDVLITAGLIDIKEWKSEIQDCAALPISLNLRGTKPPLEKMASAAMAIAEMRYNKYSQFGEDGVIETIFRLIGMANKWCFEVGAADGLLFSNTRNLVEQGWKAILVESDVETYQRLLKNATADCICENVKLEPGGPNSLDNILRRHNAPKNIDLVSIDIDGQEWHVWNASLDYRPRVVVIEYCNTNDEEFIPTRGGAGQAGFVAILRLVASKGYVPVMRTDTNIICIKKDLEPLLYNILKDNNKTETKAETETETETETKIETRPEDKPIKIHAVMSMPRLAFTDNMYSAIRVFPALGIGFDKGTGVFWGQILTNLIEQHQGDGTEFVITLDYDTWFLREHVIRLLQLMVENPDVDAIVPVEIKRENEVPMFSIVDENGVGLKKVSVAMFDKELVPIVGGHFGLSIFRVESLKKLKKPWFIPHPNKDGEWHKGKIDEDIHFWHNFYECGLKACLATKINVGHLQLTCTFPGTPAKQWKPEQIYMSKVEKGEYPEHCVPKIEFLR